MNQAKQNNRFDYYCRLLFTRIKPVKWVLLGLILLQIICDIAISVNEGSVFFFNSDFVIYHAYEYPIFMYWGAISCALMLAVTINPITNKHDYSINTDRRTALLADITILLAFITLCTLIDLLVPVIKNLILYWTYGSGGRVDIAWFNPASKLVLLQGLKNLWIVILFGGGCYVIMKSFSFNMKAGILGTIVVALTITMVLVLTNQMTFSTQGFSIGTQTAISFCMTVVLISIQVAGITWLNYVGDRIR